MKFIWFMLGGFSLLLGSVGVVLPILPTVPFLLLSAFFFAKSSSRVHDWLLSHKIFGEMITDWYERGAINRKAKYFATLSIVSILGLSLIIGLKIMVIYIQVSVLSLVLIFIWTRPDS